MTHASPNDERQLSSEGLMAAVGTAIDAIHTPRARYLPAALLGFMMLFDFWDAAVVGYVMPSIAKEWGLKPLVMGSILSAGFAGQFIGAMLLGGVAERYGRMRVLLPAVAVMALLALACAAVGSVWALSTVRFLQGLLVGGAFPVAATYINEIAPTEKRGRYFGVFQTIAVFGSMFSAIASNFIIPWGGWRLMFALGAIPLLALPFVPMFLPESPRWLARSGDVDAVNRALVKLGGKPVSEASCSSAQGAGKRPGIPLTTLFGSGVRRRTVVMVMLWYFTMTVSLGLSAWMPSVYTTVYHLPIRDALHYSTIFSVLYILGMPFVFILIDRFGRRRLSILLLSVSASALLLLALVQQLTITLLVVVVVLGHWSAGMATLILWPYTAEIYPTRIRSLAVGFASSAGRASSMITPLIVGALLGMTGSVQPIFAMFAGCILLCIVLWRWGTRETLGVSLDDVK